MTVPRRPIERTPERDETFLAQLREGATVRVAATAAGYIRQSVYDYRADDEAFAKAWEEAKAEGDDAIRDEIKRRGVDGWDEPVFYQGKEVSTVRKYSDRMLELLAKSRMPEFRDRTEMTLQDPDGKPIGAGQPVLILTIAGASAPALTPPHLLLDDKDKTPGS